MNDKPNHNKSMKDDAVIVGIISDTHGLLRPSVKHAFKEADWILHAGDIGNKETLQELETIAEVRAVCGNTDRGTRLAEHLPHEEFVTIEEATFYIVHDPEDISVAPVSAGVQAVITGHTHKAHAEWRSGVLYLNPGSAGPIRRMGRKPSVALITIRSQKLTYNFITLT